MNTEVNLAFMGHTIRMTTYNTRAIGAWSELSYAISGIYDIFIQNRNELAQIGVLEPLHEKFSKILDISSQQGEILEAILASQETLNSEIDKYLELDDEL